MPTDVIEKQRERVFALACLVGAVLHVATTIVQALLQGGVPSGLLPAAALDVLFASAGLSLRAGVSLETTATCVGAGAAILVPGIATQTGGMASPVLLASPLIPLVMAAVLPRRGLVLVTGLLLTAILGIATASAAGRLPPLPYGPTAWLVMATTIACLCIAASAVAGWLLGREQARGRDALVRLAEELREASTHDELTGLYNRRYLLERLEEELAFARRHSAPLSVLTLDVDHFKSINDRHGHAAGDSVLVELGKRLTGATRREDVIARMGGEEFLILLRSTDRRGATATAERVREMVAEREFPWREGSLAVTVSIGCASLGEGAAASIDALLGTADRRLYQAKRAGRNRVVADSLVMRAAPRSPSRPEIEEAATPSEAPPGPR
jgi:diguanylate cyclase (GGDEF)-like protein